MVQRDSPFSISIQYRYYQYVIRRLMFSITIALHGRKAYAIMHQMRVRKGLLTRA